MMRYSKRDPNSVLREGEKGYKPDPNNVLREGERCSTCPHPSLCKNGCIYTKIDGKKK